MPYFLKKFCSMKNKPRTLKGATLTPHSFRVPLDHAAPDRGTLKIHAVEVTATRPDADKLPFLVFLQGGPGFEAPRPRKITGWLKHALKDYRVLLLDQRGTGNSSPVTVAALEKLGTPERQAEYLSFFRADAIVKDCEMIRAQLAPHQKWSLLGQSFGGFCAVHYLSAHPESLSSVMLAGGLPPLTATPEEVYAATFRTMAVRNHDFCATYKNDLPAVARVFNYLAAHPVTLPSGGTLTPRRLQQAGYVFGGDGGAEDIRDMLTEAFNKRGTLRKDFLREVDGLQYYETHPIYALLQESIYCDGTSSDWAAQRARTAAFDADGTQPAFTGEMVFPWMFDDYKLLQPLKGAAGLLAKKEWGKLYDFNTLAGNTVPVAAVIYDTDLYVDRDLSLAAAQKIGNTRLVIDKKHDHYGLFEDRKIMKQLIRLTVS